MQVTPAEHLAARITAFQFGPSGRAILGRLFADTRPEAELIAREIAGKLSRDKPATKR